MRSKLSTREIQLAEKEMLDAVVKILDKNDLEYYLIGGTLLGAIRHKGFIPWDDDIDIAMPRKDYDKLQKIISKNKNILGDNLYFHSLELGNLNFPFTKVYNHDILVRDWRYNDKYEKYLWIDIFPIDGLPSNDEECNKMYKNASFYKKLLAYRKSTLKFLFHNKKKLPLNILKMFIKIFLNIIPSKVILNGFMKQIKKYPYDKCSYVGNFVWGYGPNEKMKKECLKYINVEFEGSIYKGLKNYDEYLSSLYGDYMKLPPEDKRVTHNFEAWKVKDE